MIQVPAMIIWAITGGLLAHGELRHKQPEPTAQYRFTTAETFPFYRDVYGQAQVEPFVLAPDPEDARLLAEWRACGEGCDEDGTAGLPVVDDKDLVEVPE
jgi:hypothetical protein